MPGTSTTSTPFPQIQDGNNFQVYYIRFAFLVCGDGPAPISFPTHRFPAQVWALLHKPVGSLRDALRNLRSLGAADGVAIPTTSAGDDVPSALRQGNQLIDCHFTGVMRG